MKAAKRFLAFALVFLMLFGELGSPIAMAATPVTLLLLAGVIFAAGKLVKNR